MGNHPSNYAGMVFSVNNASPPGPLTQQTTRARPARPARDRDAQDLLIPALMMLVANLLLMIGVLLCASLILSPAGVILCVQATRLSWRSLKRLIGK